MSNGTEENTGFDFSNFFRNYGGDILGTIGGLSMFNQLTGLGKELETKALDIGEEAKAGAAFKPFTVSTGFGGISTTPEGGFTTTLSPYGQEFQTGTRGITSDLLGRFGADVPDVSGITADAFGGVGGLMSSAAGDPAAREAAIYERIRAAQRPEEERQALALEERLASQGRTGLRTAQFGGSPEQLALAKAREEAKLAASVGAMEQARAEQLQDLSVAEGLFGIGSRGAALPTALRSGELGNVAAALGLSYMPEQELLKTLTPGISLADISGAGRRAGSGFLAEAGMAGLAERLGAEKTKIEGIASLINALAQPGARGTGGEGGGTPGLFDFFVSQF